MEEDAPNYTAQLEQALTDLCRATGHVWAYSGKPKRVKVEKEIMHYPADATEPQAAN